MRKSASWMMMAGLISTISLNAITNSQVKNVWIKALRIEANSRAYHPICEYLEQLEWDGQERIRYVLQRYMGADASDFVYEVVKHFLMEALSRIYRPGCKSR